MDKFTVDSASGDTTVAGTLDVTDTTTLKGATTVQNVLQVKDSGSNINFTVQQNGNTQVGGEMNVDQSMTVGGATTLNSTFNVIGDDNESCFSVGLDGDEHGHGHGTVNIAHDLTVSGGDSTAEFAGNVILSNDAKTLTVSGDLDAEKNITLTGDTNDKYLQTKNGIGDHTFRVQASSGETNVYGALTVGTAGDPKATALNGALTVSGATTLGDDLTVQGDTTNLESTLNVTGATTLNGGMNCSSATCTGDLSVSGTSTLTGNVTANAELKKMNGDVDVFRVTNTDATLTSANLTVDDGNVTVKTAAGATIFQVDQGNSKTLIRGVDLEVT